MSPYVWFLAFTFGVAAAGFGVAGFDAWRERRDRARRRAESATNLAIWCALAVVIDQARRDVDESADFREWSKEIGA